VKLSVDLDALGASSRVGFGQCARNGDAGSEVHLVGGLGARVGTPEARA
jgi:hypothetical protein